MSNDQEFFDLFKEAGDQLTEQPSEQTWRRLEGRLEKNRRAKRRKPDFLPGTTVAAVILLLFVAALVGWIVTAQHQQRRQAENAFAELQSLSGMWENKTRQTVERMNWIIDTFGAGDILLQGGKFIYFEGIDVYKGQIILKKTNKNLYLTIYGRDDRIETTFELARFVPHNVLFINKKSRIEARFVFLANGDYSLQIGSGQNFIFSKYIVTSEYDGPSNSHL